MVMIIRVCEKKRQGVGSVTQVTSDELRDDLSNNHPGVVSCALATSRYPRPGQPAAEFSPSAGRGAVSGSRRSVVTVPRAAE